MLRNMLGANDHRLTYHGSRLSHVGRWQEQSDIQHIASGGLQSFYNINEKLLRTIHLPISCDKIGLHTVLPRKLLIFSIHQDRWFRLRLLIRISLQ